VSVSHAAGGHDRVVGVCALVAEVRTGARVVHAPVGRRSVVQHGGAVRAGRGVGPALGGEGIGVVGLHLVRRQRRRVDRRLVHTPGVEVGGGLGVVGVGAQIERSGVVVDRAGLSLHGHLLAVDVQTHVGPVVGADQMVPHPVLPARVVRHQQRQRAAPDRERERHRVGVRTAIGDPQAVLVIGGHRRGVGLLDQVAEVAVAERSRRGLGPRLERDLRTGRVQAGGVGGLGVGRRAVQADGRIRVAVDCPRRPVGDRGVRARRVPVRRRVGEVPRALAEAPVGHRAATQHCLRVGVRSECRRRVRE